MIRFSRGVGVLVGFAAVFVLGVAFGAVRQPAQAQEEMTPQQYIIQAGAAGPANIEALLFAPQSLQVHRGDTVTWMINGFHNVRFGTAPIDLLTPLEMEGQPPLQINPAVAFPSIENGAAYTGGEVGSGLPGAEGTPPFSLVMDVEPGSYSYFCDVHPGMLGTITVVEADVAIPSPIEAAMQGGQEIGDTIGAAMAAHAELSANTPMMNEGDTLQVMAGSVGPGRATINLFYPFTAVARVGQTVTFTVPEGSNDPHTVSWPPLYGQEVVPVEQEGGPPILTAGPSLIPSTENGAAIGADGVFNSGFLLPGQSFSISFSEPGAYPYVCSLHAGMQGTIVVVE